MADYKIESAGQVSSALCRWAVCYDIDGKNYDDRQPRTRTVAVFELPYQAEDFIEKCLPADNRERFYIIQI